MTRSSPGVLRVAAILNFMADHPGQAFALTDLVRALKLSRATCHALLAGLVDVGYLYRASDKTYVLGPKLAAIGRTAAQNLSPLQVAQPEMRRLADEFDVVCSAFFCDGKTIDLRERAASLSHVGYSVPLGTRIRMRAPSAAVFLSWSPAEAEAWLKTAEPQPTAEEREAMRSAMRFSVKHGFTAFVRDPDATSSMGPPDELSGEINRTIRVSLMEELDPDRIYEVVSILAPVFGGDGKVAFVMGLMGFNRSMTGSAMVADAKRLQDTCHRIGGFISDRRA